MKHLKLKGVGILFLGFLMYGLSAFSLPPEEEEGPVQSLVRHRDEREIEPLLILSSNKCTEIPPAEEEWIFVDSRRRKKEAQRHSKKKFSLKKRQPSPSLGKQKSEDSDSGIMMPAEGIHGLGSESEWKGVSVRTPAQGGHVSSKFYYNLGLTDILPSSPEGEGSYWHGPVLLSLKKKEWKVIISAQFGEPEGQEDEVFYGSAPIAWAQDYMVLRRHADNLFPVLGDLFTGLRLTSLDLSGCYLQAGHLSEIFASIGPLTHLDVSHNELTQLPLALEEWFRHRGRYLKSLNVSDNPWESDALRRLRLAVKGSPVHTLVLQKVGLKGGWNVLQGFFGEEGYTNLSHLDVRGNLLQLKVSSLLGGLLRRPSFSLLADDFRIEVDHQRKKKTRAQPLEEEAEKYILPADKLPLVKLIHAGGTVETVTLPATVPWELPLLRKLMPLKIEHLEILGEAIHPLDSISEIFSLADLKTLKLGASALNAPGVMERIAKGLVYHRHLSKLLLNGGEDVSLGSMETLLSALTKNHTDDLSGKGRKMLKRFQKQIAQLATLPEPLTPVQTKEKEKKERKVAELTGQRPLTLVFPPQLSLYKARIHDTLRSREAAHIKVEFSEN